MDRLTEPAGGGRRARAPTSSGPRSRPSRRSSPHTSGAPRGRRGERHRRPDDRAPRARRGRRATRWSAPRFTFYATAEAVVNAGAARSSATSTRTPPAPPPTPCAPPSRRARRRSCRCTCSATWPPWPSCASWACRCSRTRPRPPAPHSAACARARSATRPPSASSPPRTCPAWATAARSPPTRTRWPSGPARCASTAPRTRRTHTDVGYNSRLDSLQAAVLRVLLPELDGWNAPPRARWRRPTSAAGLGELVRPLAATDGAEHVYHLYVARSERADELAAALNERGVGARGYYRTPAHRQAAMSGLRGRRAARHRRAGAHDPRPADGPRAGRASR